MFAKGSGLLIQGKPLLTTRLKASLTVRGKVARPTHHHLAKKIVFAHTDIVTGSKGVEAENNRAMSFGLFSEEMSVIVVSRRPGPVR